MGQASAVTRHRCVHTDTHAWQPGHGVGSFLNVHEGPQGISYRLSTDRSSVLPYFPDLDLLL